MHLSDEWTEDDALLRERDQVMLEQQLRWIQSPIWLEGPENVEIVAGWIARERVSIINNVTWCITMSFISVLLFT